MNNLTITLQRALKTLSEKDISTLSEIVIRRLYPKDTIVCEEGKMEHTFYIIESGMVSVTQKLDDGSDRMLQVMRDGEFFGEMGVLDKSPRAATVQTLMDSWLIEISDETFRDVLERNPSVAFTLLHGISENLRTSERLTIAELQLKNNELAKALEDLKAAQAELLRQERVNSELAIASQVQESILPTSFPDAKHLEFGYVSRPAREVGGDFYDVFDLGDDHYGVVVADVSGKSWPAAIFMAVVRALLSREVVESRSPGEIMYRLHKQVMKVSRADMFVTIFYAVINTQTRKMRYVRAGHDRPLLYRPADSKIHLLDANGRFVGLWPELIVEEEEMILIEGDTLVCYSDGVPDAENIDGETFGIERLQEAVATNGHLSAQAVADTIRDKVDEFRNQAPASDDITILVTKVIETRSLAKES